MYSPVLFCLDACFSCDDGFFPGCPGCFFDRSLLLLIWLLKNSMHVLTGYTVVVAYSLRYALSCTATALGVYCSLVVVRSCLTLTVVLVTYEDCPFRILFLPRPGVCAPIVCSINTCRSDASCSCLACSLLISL